MSGRLKLAEVFGWIDARYSGWRRLAAGWSDSDAAVGEMLGSGVRAWGYRGGALGLLPVAPVTVQSGRNTVDVQVESHARGMMLPLVSRHTYTEVEIEVSGLVGYCDGAFGLPVETYASLVRVTEPSIRKKARYQREKVTQIAEQLWPHGNLPPSQKAAVQAVRVSLERQKESPPSDTTIRRALGFRD